MNIILRNTATGLMYAGTGTWTGDHAEAVDFQQPNLALDKVEEENLQDMEVLMHFQNPPFDVPLTIVNGGATRKPVS
jgi:hypothetical protein